MDKVLIKVSELIWLHHYENGLNLSLIDIGQPNMLLCISRLEAGIVNEH